MKIFKNIITGKLAEQWKLPVPVREAISWSSALKINCARYLDNGASGEKNSNVYQNNFVIVVQICEGVMSF